MTALTQSTVLTQSKEWQALKAHYDQIGQQHMRDQFNDEPVEKEADDDKTGRVEYFSVREGGLFLDYSKNRITRQTMTLLFDLARYAKVESWRDRMFGGDKINVTEDRAVLHTALRSKETEPLRVDSRDVRPEISRVRTRIREFANAIRSGTWRGANDDRITDVVNIGIGGSDLGPRLVTEALSQGVSAGALSGERQEPTPAGDGPHQDLRWHFVSNADSADISSTLAKLSWDRTLFVICSKTFTTQETMLNANTAKAWFLEQGGSQADVALHFAAATTNKEAAGEFGIDPDNMFEFWDWVGGRYSLWSAVGLTIAIALGTDKFDRLLDGAAAMDDHFQRAPLEQNMPVIMAMLGIWYNNFFNIHSHAIIPYSHKLTRFPAFLQQCDMESNGKSVDRDGNQVSYATGPVIWGGTGIDCQHSFFQRLHQGTGFIPADFIAMLAPDAPDTLTKRHHAVLLANFIAQTEALMTGRDEAGARRELANAGLSGSALEALLPHKIFPGNRPTNTLLVDRLDPETLGALLALYEHKIFVQGIIWNLNSFDQWGVELGKELARSVLPDLSGSAPQTRRDGSSRALINQIRDALR